MSQRGYRRKPGDNPVDDVVYNEIDCYGEETSKLFRDTSKEFGEVGRERLLQLVDTARFSEAAEQHRKVGATLHSLTVEVWNSLILERRENPSKFEKKSE
jgi:hypothetical protein